jgi:aspartate ammonia-lyase
MSQSTNDTYPTTMRISIISQYKEISNAVKLLEKSFAKKAKEFKRVIKT